jgi:FlaA1/EpsC-like NDP-sugar epimerase
MKQFFLRFKTLPRWIILLLDAFILGWAFCLAYFIANQFQFSVINPTHFFVASLAYTLIGLPIFYVMRIHTGLIRYSDMRDMLKIFSAMTLVSVVFLLIGYFGLRYIIPITFQNFLLIALISFFVGTLGLIMLRIAAKFMYLVLMRRVADAEVIRVLIYGTDQNAIMAKQALESSTRAHYIILGFVDTGRTKLNSYIQQKRVYHVKDLPQLSEKFTIQQMILVNEHLGSREKRVIVERCLRLGIKVYTVPPATEWASGKLKVEQIKNLRIEDLLQRAPIRINNHAIGEDLIGKRILVTGAAGSIGSEIVRQVLKYDPQLLILCDQAETPMHDVQLEMEEKFPNSRTVLAIVDIRNLERLHDIFNDYRPEIVYHAAAYKHVPMMEKNPREAISTNVEGTRNVADLSVLFGVRKFVMISTDKAVNPTNVMGASKRIAEIYTQCLDKSQTLALETGHGQTLIKGTRFITTRFGNVLGSNGSVIPRFRAQIEKGGPITVTHPAITRYFMTIPEAVQLVLEAGTMGKGGEIYLFDMGKPVKIVDLANKMIQLAGLVPEKDIEVVFSGLRSGEKLYEELLNDAELTVPTHHPKISVAKVKPMDIEGSKRAIYELIALNARKNNTAIVRKMKEIVPEFLSKNSPFEALDDAPTNVDNA